MLSAASPSAPAMFARAPLWAGAQSDVMYFADHLVFTTRIDPASVRCWLYGSHVTSVVGELEYDMAVRWTLLEAVPSSAANSSIVTCTVDQSARACPAH